MLPKIHEAPVVSTRIGAVCPCEDLTTPALLSHRERREKDRKRVFFVLSCSPSLPLGERG
jgi:hypothetical protein